MLHFELDVPEEATDGAPVIVLLHGRGSNERDLLGLRPHLPAEAILVAPRAPFEGAPWGYGPGWAWYRYLGGTTPEPDSFERSQQELEGFLRELPGKLPVRPGPVVLGGFSQGGTMSLAYGLRNSGSLPLVINFSGFLADHPSVKADAASVRGTRFFWGHGTRDPAIPFATAQAGWQALRGAGAELEAREYPIGHWIAPEELDDVVAWLRRGLAPDEAQSADA